MLLATHLARNKEYTGSTSTCFGLACAYRLLGRSEKLAGSSSLLGLVPRKPGTL